MALYNRHPHALDDSQDHVEPTETTLLITPETRSTRTQPTTIAGECINLFRAAIPISGGYLLQNSIQVASIMIIGRLGPLELSIVASGFMIATCTGWLLAVGGTTAIDALGSRATAKSEAVNNAEDNDGNDDDEVPTESLGLLLQRCFLILTILYFFVVLLWFFVGPLLLMCGQSHELAYGTQTFLRYLSPCGLGYIYFETLKKYLQCQGHSTPGAVILLIAAAANVPTCWIVVHKLGLGIIGGTLATGAMYWLAFALLLGWTWRLRRSCSWETPSKAIFQDLWPVIKLVLLGIVIVGAEWWGFELIAIAAGVMGDVSIATQSIVMTVDSILVLIPFGLGVASTNRVAYLLARDEVGNARIAARSASCLATVNGCFMMTTILVFREHISRIFSSDPGVIAFAVVIFPWGAAFQVVDSLQATNSGCLRGMGRADIAASFNLVAYYVIALPLGLLLGFHFNWGLHGLWFGLALALAIVGIGECSLVNLVQWMRYVDLQSAGTHAQI